MACFAGAAYYGMNDPGIEYLSSREHTVSIREDRSHYPHFKPFAPSNRSLGPQGLESFAPRKHYTVTVGSSSEIDNLPYSERMRPERRHST
jgi:hypothetical protein